MKTEIDVKLVEEAIELIESINIRSHTLPTTIDKLKQAIATEPQFYKGQQGLVSDDKISWYAAKLVRYDKEKDFPFVVEKFGDSFTKPCMFFKPDPEAVTLPVWLPVSEKMPMPPGSHFSADRTMYCMIPPYEVLS